MLQLCLSNSDQNFTSFGYYLDSKKTLAHVDFLKFTQNKIKGMSADMLKSCLLYRGKQIC